MDRFRDRMQQVKRVFEGIGARVASGADRDRRGERRGERAKQSAHGERRTGRNVELG